MASYVDSTDSIRIALVWPWTLLASQESRLDQPRQIALATKLQDAWPFRKGTTTAFYNGATQEQAKLGTKMLTTFWCTCESICRTDKVRSEEVVMDVTVVVKIASTHRPPWLLQQGSFTYRWWDEAKKSLMKIPNLQLWTGGNILLNGGRSETPANPTRCWAGKLRFYLRRSAALLVSPLANG